MLQTFWRRLTAPQSSPGPAASTMPEPAAAPTASRREWQEIGALQIYKGYTEADLRVLDKVSRPSASQPGFVVDFLGSRTRVSMLYDGVHHLSGHVHGIPAPGDFHAEGAEWVGVMKTALTARRRYVAMEWGAGWGPWLVAGAKAAQNLGIADLKLYGVEADPLHFETMRQHFIDNDLPPKRHVLLQAAVGPTAGSARWPADVDPRNQWGARPVRDNSGIDEGYLGARVDAFLDVDILEATELLRREPSWDMVHIDIQGWEGEVCRSCIDTLTERVKWVVIGVHSRILDAELLQIFHAAGWLLEHEKPTQFGYIPGSATFEAMAIADGTQVWRNPTLVGAAVLA